MKSEGKQVKLYYRIVNFGECLISYVNWKLWGPISIVVVLIFLSGIINASDGDHQVEIKKIPLTELKLRQWMSGIEELLEKRNSKTVSIPGRLISELVFWGKENRGTLKEWITMSDPDLFLGLCMTIDSTRRNYRKIIEHDRQVSETHLLAKERKDLLGMIYIPSPPQLTGKDMSDIHIYECNFDHIERLLTELFPDLPPLVAEAQSEPVHFEEGEEKVKELNVSPLSWRVISRSRFGPKLIRKPKSD